MNRENLDVPINSHNQRSLMFMANVEKNLYIEFGLNSKRDSS